MSRLRRRQLANFHNDGKSRRFLGLFSVSPRFILVISIVLTATMPFYIFFSVPEFSKNDGGRSLNKPPFLSSPNTTDHHSAQSSTRQKAVEFLSEPLNLASPTVKVHTMLPSPSLLAKSPSTIVTGYFRVRSKFAAENYITWMSEMLSLQDAMVIFTDREMVETIKKFRQHATNRTVIVEMKLTDLPISQLMRGEGEEKSSNIFWQRQLEIDKERRLHKSFELFWVWLSKSWEVAQAVEHNWFQSDFFMYSDIGCFRSKGYGNKFLIPHGAGNSALGENIIKIVPDHDTVLWMAHHKPNAPPHYLWNDKFTQKQHYYHSGSQGAGYKEAWQQYHAKFAEVIDEFVAAGMFIGEDQCVLQATCQKYPHLCAYVPFDQVKDNHYFGLRHVLHYGGNYNLWRPPQTTK